MTDTELQSINVTSSATESDSGATAQDYVREVHAAVDQLAERSREHEMGTQDFLRQNLMSLSIVFLAPFAVSLAAIIFVAVYGPEYSALIVLAILVITVCVYFVVILLLSGVMGVTKSSELIFGLRDMLKNIRSSGKAD